MFKFRNVRFKSARVSLSKQNIENFMLINEGLKVLGSSGVNKFGDMMIAITIIFIMMVIITIIVISVKIYIFVIVVINIITVIVIRTKVYIIVIINSDSSLRSLEELGLNIIMVCRL